MGNEIFTEPHDVVKVRGKEYQVGELPALALLALATTLAKAAKKIGKVEPDLSGNVNQGTAIINVLASVGPEDLAEVVGIVLGCKDRAVLDGLKLSELEAIVDSFVKYNDIGVVSKNVMRVIGKLAPRAPEQQTASTPGL